MTKASTAPGNDGATVSVRMYRQGLGDCFLLAFPIAGGEFFVLIDCGVILGTKDPEKRMKEVAEDLQKRTGGHIHVLIATHEHWDHLSGFVQAQDVFQKITVDTLWLAWTEDPKDPLARKLKAERGKALRALHAAVEEMHALGLDQDVASRFGDVLGFFGGLSARGAATTGDALEFLRDHARAVRFCRPNDVLSLPGVAGARAFVLGPPEDEALIKKTNPTKKGQETYGMSTALSPEDAFLAAVHHRATGERGLSAEERDVLELSFPFDAGLKISPARAEKKPFFQEHYGFAGKTRDAWRRIDSDWLTAAGALALQLDNATNNTSLALAIELSDDGKVLLFPGDAQVGNWLSWERCSWTVPAGAKERHVDAADLLARTVLYKVGHHASHNATMRAKGLELMTNPDLVAMIPVDHAMAVKKRWDMPFQNLLKRLADRTSGRVLRIDTGLPDKPKDVSASQWKAFRDCVTITPLSIQYDVTP